MSKKKPIKTEWNQDDRRDLSDMTKEEMKEVEKKFEESLFNLQDKYKKFLPKQR